MKALYRFVLHVATCVTNDIQIVCSQGIRDIDDNMQMV